MTGRVEDMRGEERRGRIKLNEGQKRERGGSVWVLCAQGCE